MCVFDLSENDASLETPRLGLFFPIAIVGFFSTLKNAALGQVSWVGPVILAHRRQTQEGWKFEVSVGSIPKLHIKNQIKLAGPQGKDDPSPSLA